MTQADGDFLRGVRAIGQYVGLPERAMRHVIRTGRFPHFRMGTATICSRKSDIDNWINAQIKNNLESGGSRELTGAQLRDLIEKNIAGGSNGRA